MERVNENVEPHPPAFLRKQERGRHLQSRPDGGDIPSTRMFLLHHAAHPHASRCPEKSHSDVRG